MQPKTNVPLKDYSTMRLGGTAKALCEVHTKADLEQALQWAEAEQLPVIMIGEGSNIVWRDEGFPGLVIVNMLTMFERIDEDDSSATYRIGAGEEWDHVVARLVDANLSGVECLSLIPGTAGATPVQNVGAYGQEIAQTLVSLEAYDTKEKQYVTLSREDCAFGYRTSRFKTTDKGRFFITSITLKLRKALPAPPFYAALQAYLDAHDIHEFTPQVLREAVIAIRSEKLPDWRKVANNGSFFANPVISHDVLEELTKAYPHIVAWEHEGTYKIAAAWLVEQAGFRGYHDPDTGMATSEKQALVLINEHAAATADLLRFKQKIITAVQEKFGITLEQEPELLP